MISPESRSDLGSYSVAAAVRAALRQRRNAVFASTAALMIGSPEAFAQQAPNSSEQTPATAGALTEIVVTAQHRKQAAEDIPYNISVSSGKDIANTGATTINDLSRVVAGLVTVDQGPAARVATNDLTLRGLRTDPPGGGVAEIYSPHSTVNTVSTYFGETPIFFPMVLEDIDRVEVLRGPQGTLYGSGAEAGTIRIIPRQPDFSEVAAEVSVTGSYTDYAVQPNSNVHGMLNFPISDYLALRLVAGYEHLAGFIKANNLWELGANGVPIPSVPGDLSSGPVIEPEQRGVNSSNQSFGRASLLWKPLAWVDAEFLYEHQSTTQASSQVVSANWPGGCLDFSTSAPVDCATAPKSAFHANPGGPYTTGVFYLEPYADTVDVGSIVINAKFDFATLTSATSYDNDHSFTVSNPVYELIDPGGFDYNIYPNYYGYPRVNYVDNTTVSDSSFVEELRLASNGTNRFDYIGGVFYQREPRHYNVYLTDNGVTAYTRSIGQPVSSDGDVAGTEPADTIYSDRALFGELTAHITKSWQVTGGLRFFSDSYSLNLVDEEPLCGAYCSADQTNPLGEYAVNSSQKFSGHLKKFNTSYNFDSDTMLYATYSEGFRRGGTNSLPLLGPFASLPQYQDFAPDFAKNYEVGLKGSLFEHRLRYSGAIYRIDLTNFQFNSYSGSEFPATFNGSSARSQGVEIELHAAATDHLILSAAYTYTDAKTTAPVHLLDLATEALIPANGGTGPTDTLPIVNTPAGVRLPGVPNTTANIGADYTVTSSFLGHGGWPLLLHIDAVYRSWAPGNIDNTSTYYWKVPSCILTNARIALDSGKHFRYELFINNITSNTAYSGASGVQTIPNPYQLFNVTRPRTIGLTLNYKL